MGPRGRAAAALRTAAVVYEGNTLDIGKSRAVYFEV